MDVHAWMFMDGICMDVHGWMFMNKWVDVQHVHGHVHGVGMDMCMGIT